MCAFVLVFLFVCLCGGVHCLFLLFGVCVFRHVVCVVCCCVLLFCLNCVLCGLVIWCVVQDKYMGM